MQYDLVIIGATAAALGLAKTVKKTLKTLVVNRTEMVAYEFVNTYKMPEVYSKGAEYYKEFRELGVDILLRTEVTDIKSDNGRYIVEIFNCAGFQTVEARIVIDTTTERVSEIVKRSLNCLLINQGGAIFPEIEFSGVTFVEDSNGTYSTVIMKYDCDTTNMLHEARHQLIDFWHARPDILHDWKIASIGFCFEEIPAFKLCKNKENYIVLPSAYYSNPSLSVDAGIALGRSLLS